MNNIKNMCYVIYIRRSKYNGVVKFNIELLRQFWCHFYVRLLDLSEIFVFSGIVQRIFLQTTCGNWDSEYKGQYDGSALICFSDLSKRITI